MPSYSNVLIEVQPYLWCKQQASGSACDQQVHRVALALLSGDWVWQETRILLTYSAGGLPCIPGQGKGTSDHEEPDIDIDSANTWVRLAG